MNSDQKVARIRSPSYPFMDLESAIGKCKLLFKFAKMTSVRISTALPQLNYKSASSANGMKAIAALKSFGLVTTSGKKNLREVEVTDSARRIIHGVVGSDEYNKHVQEAALRPEMYRYVWDKYGPLSEMPEDGAVGSHLIIDKKFNETAVSGFLNDYRRTIEFAKIVGSDTLDEEERNGNGDDNDSDKEVRIGDCVQWEPDGVLQFADPKRVTKVTSDGKFVIVEGSDAGLPIEEVTIVEQAGEDNISELPAARFAMDIQSPVPGVRKDVWNLDEGPVVLQYPSKMTAGSYEDFESWINLQLIKIKRGVIN